MGGGGECCSTFTEDNLSSAAQHLFALYSLGLILKVDSGLFLSALRFLSLFLIG